jgi:hypothetical protein
MRQQTMRSFLDSPTNPNSTEPTIHATRGYLEIEWPINESTCAVLYAIPRTESSAFIVTSWEDSFDEFLNNTDSNDWETVVETWPTLATLLSNGVNDKYRDGALIRLDDIDYGDAKWFVASVAGNVSFDSEESFFTERTVDTMQTVMSKSAELMVELRENKPSIARAIGKGIMSGLGTLALSAIAITLGADPDEYIQF